MKKTILFIYLCFSFLLVQAQTQSDWTHLPQGHPRYLTTPDGRDATLRLIAEETWAADVLRQLLSKTDKYVQLTEEQPDWLLSRLAMYWKSHATDVYVKGENFDHAGGERAPVPTVRYTGTRGTAATHGRPKLADVVPYDDDEASNVTFCNNSLPDRPMERVHPSKTGRNIESLNREIMGIARDAAFLYWLTEDERYARLAAGVFNTYMQGIYYRNVPIDLNHGHQQTLVGMSSFEVIHEDILNEIIPLYDFLHAYLSKHYADHMDIYAGALKKWAENIIANGVPHNNWNLMQARYVMNIGMVLEDDTAYADRKGRSYYIDYVLNKSSIRQWSLKRLADYGYDAATGIWAECPGYSQVVMNDYANFTNLFDRNLGFDLTAELPVITKAVAAMPQYLFPNRMICGFGDTHPAPLSTMHAKRMISNAQTHGKKEQEIYFTALLKCLEEEGSDKPQVTSDKKPAPKKVPVSINSFFDEKPLVLDSSIPAGKIEDYVSPLFYAPNVSWLVQRNGMNPRHSLMVSLNGSEGNHMHANGISLEFYGKGYVLAPDAGIGQYLYSGLDYAEYYSQFPSHNTVCVDGISSYPVMKSNHSFRVNSCFPLLPRSSSLAAEPSSLVAENGVFHPLTYSDLYFREPESHADQTRLTGIVTIDSLAGYYVDIFRSRKVAGGDKMHDYFYHNLGQTMNLTAADGTELRLQPTEELAFAGAHLYAYSYIYDKKMVVTNKDAKTTFTMAMPGGDDITMTMWMKGAENRQLFTALSPMTEGYSRIPDMPYTIKEQPTLTFVARQQGEAWNHPFVAVYEPSSIHEPARIVSVAYPEVKADKAGSHVGIRVMLQGGEVDRILSSDQPDALCSVNGLESRATYAFCRQGTGGANLLFMGNGTYLHADGITVKASQPCQVLLQRVAAGWSCQASADCQVSISGKKYKVKAGIKSLL